MDPADAVSHSVWRLVHRLGRGRVDRPLEVANSIKEKRATGVMALAVGQCCVWIVSGGDRTAMLRSNLEIPTGHPKDTRYTWEGHDQ